MTDSNKPDETAAADTIDEAPNEWDDFHSNEATLQRAHDSSIPAGSAGSTKALPERFGRYRIERRLGQGAMGAVYLAHDSQLDRKVALKVPLFNEDDGPDAVDRFRREARAMATLRHPHICPVFDVGEIDGVQYLTMAFIDGHPLSAELTKAKTLSNRRAAELLRKIARALEVAHKAGIVHRDIKPANIMMDDANDPIVMDFGLARRHREGEASLTHSGAIMGTPAYMAPEQVEGRHEDIGGKTDIYALGVMLYQMIGGRLPFEGTTGSVMAKILTESPPPPSTIDGNVDSRLEAICLKAMSKSSEDRYQSAGELADDLTQFLQTSDLAAPRADGMQVAETAAPAKSRTRVLAAGAVAVVLVGAIVGLFFAFGGSPPPESDSPPTTELEDQLAAGIESASTLYVLGIGINDYPHEKLRYARVDIAKICETLRQRNPASRKIEIVTLLDQEATKTRIQQEIAALRDKIGKDDIALIAYSGYEYVDGNEFYLLPVDVDMERQSETGVSATQLYELLPADMGNIVFLLDTCRSGKLAKYFGVVNPNVTVLASAEEDQLCYELQSFGGGIFTSAVVAGLEGSADSDGDGVVTLDELGPFVKTETARRAGQIGMEQNPVVSGRIRPLVLSQLPTRE